MSSRALAVIGVLAIAACGTLDASPGDTPPDPSTDGGGTESGADTGPLTDASADVSSETGSPCTDTTSDPLNCGRCGVSCDGATCVAGMCGVATVGRIVSDQSPRVMTFGPPASLYWIDRSSSGPGGGKVWRCDLPCIDIEQIGATIGGTAIVAGADDVFWTHGSADTFGSRVHVFRRTTKAIDDDGWDGAAYTPMGLVLTPAGFAFAEHGTATNNTGAAIYDRTPANASAASLPFITTVAPTFLVTSPTGVYAILEPSNDIVAVDFTTTPVIYTVIGNLGPAKILELAAIGSTFFFRTSAGAIVVACKTLGPCSGPGKVLDGTVTSVAADASGLYYTTDEALVWREDTTLAKPFITLADKLAAPGGIALSPTHVYFSDINTILSVPKPK